MKIGLYPGSFNPPHVGHFLIAEHLLEEMQADEIWMLVSPQSPFKEQADLLDERNRYALLETALESSQGIRASDVEFQLPRPSYTVNTLRHLRTLHPEYEFFLIIGSDNLEGISRWKDADEILRDYQLVVYPRPGYPVGEKALETLKGNVHLSTAPQLDISSTMVRKQIARGEAFRYKVRESTYRLIKQRSYYRSEEPLADMSQLDDKALLQIESQLRLPSGEDGIQMGLLMNESNAPMIDACIDMVPVKESLTLLELGHGNAAHVQDIMASRSSLRYEGLEISETMHAEACRINARCAQSHFTLYDGHTLPYAPQTFDSILSVNNLYFWPEPIPMFQELARVLKVGGTLILGFADAAYLSSLPFVQSKFAIYEKEEVVTMASDFRVDSSEIKEDKVRSKAGFEVLRRFHVMRFVKA